MPELLLEVGLEEIPARMIAAAESELARRVEALLTRQRLLEAAPVITSYSTPRRLAVRVQGVLAQQLDLQEQLTGPSWKAAFPDGQPGPAAQAFAKKAGVARRCAGKDHHPQRRVRRRHCSAAWPERREGSQ